MSVEDRHINFKLMREWILAHQDKVETQDDASTTPVVTGEPATGVTLNGKKYWRSLEELADTPEFHEFVQREYPQHAEEWDDPIERRSFLKLMGASLALAGLSGCVYQPPEKIVPFVRQSEESIPGKALFFATAATVAGIATPLLIRSNEGRPTKAEGNPDHPYNRGADANDRGSSATDIFAQASILGLYDPERSKTVTFREEIRTWTTFLGEMRTALDEQRPKQGAGLRFLTETITSPTIAAQLKGILTEFPQAKWHQYEPANRDNTRAGAMMAFGQPVNTIYNFDQATRVLSLDADFLSAMPGTLRYARQFAAGRRIVGGKHEMSRLYVVETTPTNTGASADHRWTVKPSALEGITRQLAARCGVSLPAETNTTNNTAAWVDAIARDLQQQKGASIVIAGNEAPPSVHALAHAMNAALGNVGKTVTYTEPLEANPVDQRESLRELVGDLDAGRVDLLVMLVGNPVYNTPADLKLDFNRLKKAKLRVHLSSHTDETSELCEWHVPESHYLESWGDTRVADGTVSIVQPLIEPLYGSKTAHEVLAVFSEKYDRKAYEIVREYWQGTGFGSQVSGAVTSTAQPQSAEGRLQTGTTPATAPQATAAAATPGSGDDFEARWRKALHDGFIANSALPIKTVAINPTALSGNASGPSASSASPDTRPPTPGTFEIVFRTDPTIFDGRFANNGWLQELPKPLTKITWDNAALMSLATAQRLGLANKIGWKGTEVFVGNIRIDHRGKAITCPAWIMPGQPDDVVTVHLGYGRRKAGTVGNNRGFSAYEIRFSDAPWAAAASVALAAGEFQLAVTQLHFNMENRDVLRTGTLADYVHSANEGAKDQGSAAHGADEHKKAFGEKDPPTHVPRPDETLYGNEHKYEGYAWGMAIDANSCIGCNACIVACQSENNIAVVGKEQVVRSREMHWLRVDAYYEGQNAASPEGTYFMPVPCMHCENAPCEPVCPVHATVHSAEGINDMVYNRCVGTRYCSNNCPYKVRRFNFLLYQDWTTPTYQLMRNPEVTVRSRGVMEKCTYCIQRIQEAKIGAELEDRPVRDGEIVTACQAVCPTETIVFGNINDPNSRVAKLKAESRNYSLLSDLNTRPRTTYLGALRNPNPELAS